MTDSDKLETVTLVLQATPEQRAVIRRYLVGSSSVAGAAAGVLMALAPAMAAMVLDPVCWAHQSQAARHAPAVPSDGLGTGFNPIRAPGAVAGRSAGSRGL